jgi:hypothetical protein
LKLFSEVILENANTVLMQQNSKKFQSITFSIAVCEMLGSASLHTSGIKWNQESKFTLELVGYLLLFSNRVPEKDTLYDVNRHHKCSGNRRRWHANRMTIAFFHTYTCQLNNNRQTRWIFIKYKISKIGRSAFCVAKRQISKYNVKSFEKI